MTIDRFRDRYRGEPEDLPWFHREPDPDLVALFDGALPPRDARVLDLGAGPAVHSIELAARGHHVVAIDGVPEARDMAWKLAAERGVEIEYLVGDALNDAPAGPFDVVFDRGFLHTLEPAERSAWRATVLRALRPGGVVILKCFDVRPARQFGPPGLSARDVLDVLGPPDVGLELELLRRTRFAGHEGHDHATWTVLAKRV